MYSLGENYCPSVLLTDKIYHEIVVPAINGYNKGNLHTNVESQRHYPVTTCCGLTERDESPSG